MNLPEYLTPRWIVIGKGSGWAAFDRITSKTLPTRDTHKQAQDDAFNQNRIARESKEF